MLQSHEKQYHINVSVGEIGKYCLLPGDPGRCEKIAAFLENPYFVIDFKISLWYNIHGG